jgi:hypothetical protein
MVLTLDLHSFHVRYHSKHCSTTYAYSVCVTLLSYHLITVIRNNKFILRLLQKMKMGALQSHDIEARRKICVFGSLLKVAKLSARRIYSGAESVCVWNGIWPRKYLLSLCTVQMSASWKVIPWCLLYLDPHIFLWQCFMRGLLGKCQKFSERQRTVSDLLSKIDFVTFTVKGIQVAKLHTISCLTCNCNRSWHMFSRSNAMWIYAVMCWWISLWNLRVVCDWHVPGSSAHLNQFVDWS